MGGGRGAVARVWSHLDPNLSLTLGDQKIFFGWNCDDLLWEGESKKRTFVV